MVTIATIRRIVIRTTTVLILLGLRLLVQVLLVL